MGAFRPFCLGDLTDKGSLENYAMEKDPIKYSTHHTEIHNPTIASMYFESASVSMVTSGC